MPYPRPSEIRRNPILQINFLPTEQLEYIEAGREVAFRVPLRLGCNKNHYKTTGYEPFRKFSGMFCGTVEMGHRGPAVLISFKLYRYMEGLQLKKIVD